MSTIAAIATGQGGAVSIVRVSGEGAENIMRAVFEPSRGYKKGKIISHRFYFGHLIDACGEHMDEMMAVIMKSPHSYTREDVLELHCHGGYVAAARALGRALEAGASPAEPGEFTRRAFMNGRIDLSQAEAVMGMISAGSEKAARASLSQLEGGVSAFIAACRNRLTALLASIEAATDFPDEIDEPVAARKAACEAIEIKDDLLSRSDEKAARIVREGVSVVIAGRPNVGKSSLMNALTGGERAIVTDIPGTTRDVLTEQLVLGGVRMRLSDTAGQREAADAVEKIGVERAKKAQETADIVLIVIDASAPLTPEDERLLREKDARGLVVLNKTDLSGAQAEIEFDACVSARTAEGIDELLRLIRARAGADDFAEDMLTSSRHIECARRAAQAIERAVQGIEQGDPLDMAAIELWEARRVLGEITGEDATESVIDAVFSTFCVGK